MKVYPTYIGDYKPNITVGTKVRTNADSLTPFYIVRFGTRSVRVRWKVMDVG